MTARSILHAGLVAARLEGLWRGALITGPSGSGKSDLAMRALAHGFRLVADDRTLIFASQGRLFGRSPNALRGLIEVRGIGVLPSGCLPLAEIVLAIECVEMPDIPERMAPLECRTLLGLAIPALRLWPFEASAPQKLRSALGHLGAQGQQAYQAALRPQGVHPARGGGKVRGVEEHSLGQS